MTRVLIVDDEAFFCRSFESYIDWAALGCQVVGTAGDGEAALDAVERLRPDLVFLDIKMPKMDGLEMLRRLRATGSEVPVVMLSGFNQFDYVIQAMRGGAQDYIYKAEMGPEIVAETVRGLQSRGAAARGAEGGTTGEKPLEAGEFLRDAINCTPRAQQPPACLRVEPANLFLLTFTIADYATVKERYGDKRDLLYSGMAGLATELRNSVEELDTIFYDKRTLCVVKSFSKAVSLKGMEKEVNYIAGRLVSGLKSFYNLRVNAGVSGRKDGFSELGRAFDEAYSAAMLEFSFEGGRAYHWKELENVNFLEYVEGEKETPALLARLEKGDEAGAGEVLARMFHLGEKKTALGPSAARSAAKSLVYALCPEGEQRQRFLAGVERAVTRSELVECLAGLCRLLCTTLSARGGSFSPPVRQSILYIHDQYADKDLGLDTIAAHIGLNPSYLSRIFKKETGTNVTDAINQTRIQAAVQRLETTDDMIYQIAGEVGYRNVEHFNRIFKRCTGRSPGDYRR